MKKFFPKINLKAFAILLALGLIGLAGVFPYLGDIIKSGLIKETDSSDLPFEIILLAAFVQNGILLSITIYFGMILSERIGLKMPIITALANRQHQVKVMQLLLPGIILGAGAGILMVAAEAMFFVKQLPQTMLSSFDIPLWKRMLAGVLYGGITEELLMRLFLLSLIAWLLGKIWKTEQGLPDAKAFWTAIIFVALIFGLGHLPATSFLTPLTPLLIIRALVLNGIAGIAYGFLYWKYGLEAAMAGHISTHLIMQTLGVVFLKLMI